MIDWVGVPRSLGLEARWPAVEGCAPVERYIGLVPGLGVTVVVALVAGLPEPLLGSRLRALASLLPIGHRPA